MSIALKYSTEAGKVPTAANLVTGELAMNAADGRFFAKKTDDTVFELLSTLNRRNDVRASGSTDSSVVTETGIRAAIDAAVSSVTSPWAVSGANIYNTNSGNVGIGTSSPSYKLDVLGEVNTQACYNIKTVAAPPATFTATPVSGTGLEIGQYWYRVCYYTIYGDSTPSSSVGAVTTSGNQRVLISNIPISSDSRVVGRKIFRGKVGESLSYGELVATIADNTTTSYTDSKPDSTLNPSIHTRAIYAKPNLSVKYISVDNVRSFILDTSLTVIGVGAGANITNPGNTVLIGPYAGERITSGQGNTIIGHFAGGQLTTGNQNVAVGQSCLQNATTGSYNIAIGINSLFKNNNSHNLGMGYYTANKSTGGYNICLGSYSSQERVGGDYNVTIGVFSFNQATASTGNVGVGAYSGERNLTGVSNIFLGRYSGGWETGSFKLIIDSLNRGSEADGRSKSLIYGEINTTTSTQHLYLNSNVYIREKLGIGTTTPSSLLDVAGTVTAYTAKLTSVGTVAAAQLLGLDADKNLTTNVLPLVLSGIQPHTAGAGLSGSSYNGSAAVTWSVNFAGTGVASSVARSDHNHDSQYSAIGHNHYLVSLADVLITSLANGQVLRYNSTIGVWENGNADQYWQRASTQLRPINAGDTLYVPASTGQIAITGTSDTTNGIRGTSTSGAGVYGSSSSSYGVHGISTNNVGVYGNGPVYGVYGQSAGIAGSAAVRAVATGAGFGLSAQAVSGYAVTGTSTSGGGGYFITSTNVGLQGTSTNGLAMALHTSPADASNIFTMLSLNRQTTGTAAAGIGISVDFQIKQASGAITSQANLFAKLTNADSVTSALGFSLRKNNASVSEVALMTPSDMSFKNENGYSLRLRSFRDYTGTPGYLKSGDYAGNLVFDAWSGASSYSSVAAISVLATADHNSSNFASKMEFWLAEPSSLYPRQVAELTPEGKVKGIFGFSVFGADGISGTSTIITGVSYDSGTMVLTFTRSTLTVSGGIITGVSAASNLTIPLSA